MHNLMYFDGVDSSLATRVSSLMSSLVRTHTHAHMLTNTHWSVRLLSTLPSPPCCRFYELPWAAIHLCHTLAPLLGSAQLCSYQSADGNVLQDVYCFCSLDNDLHLQAPNSLHALFLVFLLLNIYLNTELFCDVGRFKPSTLNEVMQWPSGKESKKIRKERERKEEKGEGNVLGKARRRTQHISLSYYSNGNKAGVPQTHLQKYE